MDFAFTLCDEDDACLTGEDGPPRFLVILKLMSNPSLICSSVDITSYFFSLFSRLLLRFSRLNFSAYAFDFFGLFDLFFP